MGEEVGGLGQLTWLTRDQEIGSKQQQEIRSSGEGLSSSLLPLRADGCDSRRSASRTLRRRDFRRFEGLDSCGRRKSARGPTPHTGLFPSFPQVLIDKNLRHPVDRVCTGVQVAIRQTPCDRAHVRGRFHRLL